MKDTRKTKSQLIAELEELRARCERLEAAADVGEESEKKFRALADSTSAIILMAGEDGRIFYANKAAEEATGYSLEELSNFEQGKTLLEPTDMARLAEEIEKARDRGEDFTAKMEFKITRKDGEERWLEASGRFVRLGDQLVDLSTSFDITERKRAEEALKESEKKFRALADSTTAQIAVVAGDGERFLYANRAALEHAGIGWEEFAAINPGKSLTLEAREAGMRAAEEAIARHESQWRFEYREGETWYDVHVAMIEIEGKPAAIYTSFDITDLKRAQQALAESEERYRTIFDTAGAGMISFGEDGIITLANEKWAEISGYSIEETVGKMTWVPFFTEASLIKMKKYHEMRTAAPNSVPTAYEAQFVDRAGTVHEGIINIQVVPGTHQRVASFQDMTALKRAQNEMYRADKMAALGQIIAGVAHEINNPNNFIVFNLPILKRYVEAILPMLEHHLAEDPSLKILNMPYALFIEDVFKLLENMEHGSKRITGIVSELKNYVRSDEEGETNRGAVAPVIDRAMALVGKQVRKMVKRFDVEVAPGLRPVRMNPGKIEQVLINMVINAGQAADKEDSWVTLTARPGEKEGGKEWVEIIVEDNGAGIPKEIRDQIFEPFFTSKGREQGTGLGLSISHKIIEDHGGTIAVESTPGEGARFTIRLPADV